MSIHQENHTDGRPLYNVGTLFLDVQDPLFTCHSDRTVRWLENAQFHICGHVHEGYGVWRMGNTTLLNASVFTWRYQPTNLPIEFEIILGKKGV